VEGGPVGFGCAETGIHVRFPRETTTDDAYTVPEQRRNSQAERISSAIANAYKQHYGRGPTVILTRFAGPDVVTCVLEDSKSPAQAKLMEVGRDDLVYEARSALQAAHQDELRTIVGEITGRRIRTMVSGLNVADDVSVETFLLEPEDETTVLPGT
jgi:uncharacterized protein YbcI